MTLEPEEIPGMTAVATTAAERPLSAAEAQRRLHGVTWLAFGSLEDFNDPRSAYRRLFAETLGTFMLVLVAGSAAILHAEGQISLTAAVVSPGLMVMAIILFMGGVSGAHLNPVVSLAFALRGDFGFSRVPGYVVAQVIGAALASAFTLAIFGHAGHLAHLGATLPGAHVDAGRALLVEVALTFTLVSVILGTASAAQNVGTVGALAVGGYIALAGMWAAPLSGASMNPVRSLGPALLSGHWTSFWIYVVGPFAGSCLAVAAAFILRGHGGADAVARAAASGHPLPTPTTPTQPDKETP